jgi:hypothetical protein
MTTTITVMAPKLPTGIAGSKSLVTTWAQSTQRATHRARAQPLDHHVPQLAALLHWHLAVAMRAVEVRAHAPDDDKEERHADARSDGGA